VDRLYCSRCLQTFVAPGPDVCTRTTCRRPRPSRGWCDFLDFGDTIDDRYLVKRILGAGGAGVTYRCHDVLDDEDTAVKVLHADRKRGTLANRLAIEGEVLELLDHPHIVPFRALKLHGDSVFYLATLHMTGGSLDGWIRRNGPLSVDGVVALGRQLGMALDYVHAGGIVHRDLKPGNVLLEEADHDKPVVRLADFGIARLFREQRPIIGLTRTGAFIGTPEYAAPEQVRGEKGIGPAADAFALGALLHYAASGNALHRRDEIHDWKAFKERRWDPADRPRLTSIVDGGGAYARDTLAELDSLIDGLMHPEPASRLDMGTAAMRLGANPAQLAPVDQPRFSPPTLVSSIDDEDEEEDELDVEALLPGDDDDEDDGEIDTDAPTIVRPAGPTPFLEKEAGPVDPRILDELPTPTRDVEDEWNDDDGAWPTREVRRNRVHGGLTIAAALLFGVVMAWPGGPAALIGQERLGALGGTLGSIGERLGVAETSYEALDAAAPPEEVRERAPAPTPRTVPASSGPSDPRRGTRTDAEPDRVAAAEEADLSISEPIHTSGHVPDGAGSVRVDVRIRPRERRVDVTARLPEPRPARLPGRPAPVEEERDNSLENWSADPDDDRSVGEVLAGDVADEQRRWLDELSRRQEEADRRAERYRRDADHDVARLDDALDRWEDVQREARKSREAENADRTDGDAGWVDERSGPFEELFGGSPRIEPLNEEQ
jgi:serine/threonine protein kinase